MLVEPGDDLLQAFDRLHVGARGIDADGKADNEILAAGLADRLQHFVGEAHAVLEAAAIFVVAPVGDGRPELLDEGVIGRHQLAAVISAGLGARGAAGEGGDDFRDLSRSHRVAAVGIVHRGQAGRRPIVGQRIVPVAVGADVIELLDNVRAFGMNRIGDAAEMRDDGIIVGAEIAARQHRGPVDRHRLHHDHRGPAHRALAVIAEMPLARQAIDAHVGGVRAEHDAVAQAEVSQLQRLKDRRMIHRFLSQREAMVAPSGEER